MKKYFLYLIISIISLLIKLCINFFGILVNVTPSMPLGIYFKKFSEPRRGDIVAACLEKPQRKFGLARHYLMAGDFCENTQPVIKQILAVPGDRVVLMKNELAVNDRRYPFITLEQDQRGKQLAAYPRGVYAPTTRYWLIGTSNAYSWDSRYWGPVSREQIVENLQPWILFGRNDFISSPGHVSNKKQNNEYRHDQRK